jgi:hypothetical protein
MLKGSPFDATTNGLDGNAQDLGGLRHGDAPAVRSATGPLPRPYRLFYPSEAWRKPLEAILVAWRKVLLSQLRQPREEYDLRRA